MKCVRKRAVDASMAAIFTAMVCAATILLSVYVPATHGYFNIGETMVYTTALLFGPFIGAFAGGIGSMLADILLGYTMYAPATLVIKACEGAIVGYLARKRLVGSKLAWRVCTLVLGLITGILLATVGSLYYSGPIEVSIGISPLVPTTLMIPPELWYAVGAVVFFLVALMGFRFEPEFGWMILSVMLGGMEMILGYYLYEWAIIGAVAIVEVVVNIGQMMVGLIVSLPLVRAVRRAFPEIKSMYR